MSHSDGDAVSGSHPRLSALVARARERAAGQLPALALVYPGDVLALDAAAQIQHAALARPVLIGPRELLIRAAAEAGVDASAFEIIDTGAAASDAAARACDLARAGHVQALMKGSLHTDELMSAVVNIAPDLKTKRDIVGNAVTLLQQLGIAEPLVGIVTAVELVNPAIPATLDAQALVALSLQGEWPGAVVEGPFGFDNVISAEAARIKKMVSRVAGQADLLLMPDLNAGNMLYKSFNYIGGGDCAGLVLGATVPIVLTSRADSLQSRIASVALAVLTAKPS